jgi:FkbM family methyltransferase
VVHAALGAAGSTGTTDFMIPLDDEHQPSSYRAHEGMGTDHLKVIEKAGAQLQKITVPLSSMDVELTKAGFGRVDFAVIDVEGGELELLKGFELRRWKPRVLVVEDNSLGADTRVTEHLAGVGYDPVMWVGANRVYVRRDDPEMQSRCRRAAETVYSPLVRPPGSLANEDRRIADC